MNSHLINSIRLSNPIKYFFGGYHLFNKNHYRNLHHKNDRKINSSSSLNLCLMKNEHRNEVSDILSNLFFRDEPISKALSFDLPKEALEFTNLSIEKALQDKCSYVAIDTNQQKLIGVSLNVIENINDKIGVFDTSQLKSEKLRYTLKIFEHLHEKVNLFEKFHTDRLLHLLMVVVHENYRGLDLTNRLTRLSIELAKTYGITATFAEATGFYSTKAMLKQEFQVYNEVIYAKYDPKRLTNLGIHDRCSLIAKSL